MNLGTLLIILALPVTVAAIVFFYRGKDGSEADQALARKLYFISSALIAFTFLLLTAAFLNHEFKYNYVYDNSSLDLAWYYQLSAVWAGQAGSFMLWLLFINLLGLALVLKGSEKEYVLMSVIAAAQIFIILLLIVDSPFRYIWDVYPKNFMPGQAPPDGGGLNPLLIDPWMISHPPFLFLGFASATIPFGYAIGALVRGEYDSWVSKARPWMIFSLTALGIGIFLGAYWAYDVLGWGGYWGWDPVENSSLIPWIIGIALVHGLIIQKRKKALTRANLAMAITYFVLVFYSTFLTRSGVLGEFSVHSFGESPIGKYLAIFISLVLAGSFALYGMRFRRIKSESLGDKFWTWQSFMTYGIITLVLYALIILIGTSMPILTGLFAAKASAVTTAYYNNISIPIGIVIIVALFLSTMSILSKDIKNLKNLLAALGAVAAAVLLNVFFTYNAAAYAFTAVGLFLVIQSVMDIVKVKNLTVLPSRLSHIGLGLLVVGVITSNFHSTDAKEKIYKDKEAKVGSVLITFKDMVQNKYTGLRFSVRDGEKVSEFTTAYYMSPKTKSLYREPHIKSGFLGDLYITPENYETGVDSQNSLVITKGEEKTIGNLRIKFLQFNSDHMNQKNPSGEMSILTDLLVNGVKVSPGMKVVQGGGTKNIDAVIPGTKRVITLLRMNASAKAIEINVTPEKETEARPDSVFVNVSHKHLIWLVWLGLTMITIGGCYGYVRSLKS